MRIDNGALELGYMNTFGNDLLEIAHILDKFKQYSDSLPENERYIFMNWLWFNTAFDEYYISQLLGMEWDK